MLFLQISSSFFKFWKVTRAPLLFAFLVLVLDFLLSETTPVGHHTQPLCCFVSLDLFHTRVLSLMYEFINKKKITLLSSSFLLALSDFMFSVPITVFPSLSPLYSLCLSGDKEATAVRSIKCWHHQASHLIRSQLRGGMQTRWRGRVNECALQPYIHKHTDHCFCHL